VPSDSEGTILQARPSRRRTIVITVVLLVMLTVIGWLLWYQDSISSESLGPETSEAGQTTLYDVSTRQRADRIISTFENSTINIQYGYAENINDGRGITAGRAGFTSSTGDLLEVVRRYCQIVPDSPLAAYLPALKVVNGTPSTKGLEGFAQAWRQAATTDQRLRGVQDRVVDEMYFNPAMKRAKDVGINTALGQLIIYDTIIQHGEGADPDGLPAIIDETVAKEGMAQGNEAAWLRRFLDVRQKHLQQAHDPATRQGWRESVPRVTALRSILGSGNFDLRPPLNLTVYGDQFHIE
jgi:chitosanase